MPCTSVVNSATVGLSIDGTVVAYSNDVTLTITHDPREITNKDSGGWADFAEGLRRWEASVSAWYVVGGAGGAEVVFGKIGTRGTAEVHVLEINTAETDAIGGMTANYAGKAWVTNLELGSPGSQDNVSFTAGLRGCGAISSDGSVPA